MSIKTTYSACNDASWDDRVSDSRHGMRVLGSSSVFAARSTQDGFVLLFKFKNMAQRVCECRPHWHFLPSTKYD